MLGYLNAIAHLFNWGKAKTKFGCPIARFKPPWAWQWPMISEYWFRDKLQLHSELAHLLRRKRDIWYSNRVVSLSIDEHICTEKSVECKEGELERTVLISSREAMRASSSSRVSSIVTDLVWPFSFTFNFKFNSRRGIRCTEMHPLANESYRSMIQWHQRPVSKKCPFLVHIAVFGLDMSIKRGYKKDVTHVNLPVKVLQKVLV